MRPHLLFALSLSLTAAWPARAETLLQLIYEKRVAGDPRTGRIPIDQLQMEPATPLPPPAQLPLALDEARPPAATAPLWRAHGPVTKRYRLAGPLQAEVWVEQAGMPMKRIPVSRKARQLLAHQGKVYVLCGGYQGSVWEINGATDLVTRRFSVIGDAQGLALHGTDLWVLGRSLDRLALGPDPRPLPAKPLKNQGKAVLDMQVPAASAPPDGDLLVVGHKNNDYLTVVDGQAGIVRALIALDAPTDDLLVRQDRRSAYVWQRTLGQVTRIDLGEGPEHFAVTGRWQRPDLVNQNLSLVEGSAGVFLWQNGVIAALTSHGLQMGGHGGPVRHPHERIWLDRDRQQRFFAEGGRLFREPLASPDRLAPAQAQEVRVGRAVQSFGLSLPTGLLATADPADDTVWLVSLADRNLRQAVPVGQSPQDLSLSRNARSAYVLNGGEGSISRVDLAQGTVRPPIPLPPPEALKLRLWDSQYRQEIRIQMPLYTRNAYVMRAL